MSCTLTVGITATSIASAAVNPAHCTDRFGTPGMASYWTFDDSASPGRDDFGHNHGTLASGALQVASGQKVGAGAMRFSGGTDHIRLDYAAFRKGSMDSFSMSAWFLADDFGGSGGMNIFGVGAPCGPDNGTFAWTLVVDPAGSGLFSTGRFCEGNNGSTSVPVQVGVWTHAVAVYDAGIILVYVDGILRVSDSFTLGTTPAPSALIAAIGNNLGDPDTRGFRGLIDEVAFFDRALTPREIPVLYDVSVSGRSYCEPSCSDQDGDGSGSPGSTDCPGDDREDCDDSDPATFPGAAETCDGIDNDCDGIVPSGELDEDRDRVRICAGDCNDRSAETFPGAREFFDGEDNDCDGLRDEGLDDDGDGIPNLNDACPGTPSGSEVGPNGCGDCGRKGRGHRGHDPDHHSGHGSRQGSGQDSGDRCRNRNDRSGDSKCQDQRRNRR